MANFDTPNSQNLTQPSELIQYVNEVTGFWFGPVILIGVFVIIFITLLGRTEKSSGAFAVASFISAITAILLRGLNVLNDTWLIVFLIMAVIGFAAVYFENR